MAGFIPWLVQQARLKASMDSLRQLAELEDVQARGAMVPPGQTQQDVEWLRMGPQRLSGERERAYLGITQDPVAAQAALGQFEQNRALRSAQEGLSGNPYALGAMGVGKAPAPPYQMNTAGIWNQYSGDSAESTPALTLGQQRMAAAERNLAAADYDAVRSAATLGKPLQAMVDGKPTYVREVSPGVYEPLTDAAGAPLTAAKAGVEGSPVTKPTHPLNTCNGFAKERGLAPGTENYAGFMATCQAEQEAMQAQGFAQPAPMLTGGGGPAQRAPQRDPVEVAPSAQADQATLEELKTWVDQALQAGVPEDYVRQLLEAQGLAWPE